MRLHLGASRHQLRQPSAKALRNGPWIHLGAPEFFEDSEPADDRYCSFFYKRGDRLPFDDATFSFAFSEHFFEHLFLDEAGELFKECFRVLQPGACFRIVVPDSDLRTYLPPEPVGYSTGDERWCHPDKHKTRWSIYSLSYILELMCFQSHGLIYCDKFGVFHKSLPQQTQAHYSNCIDAEIVLDVSYVLRFDRSLVVDAFKPLGK